MEGCLIFDFDFDFMIDTQHSAISKAMLANHTICVLTP